MNPEEKWKPDLMELEAAQYADDAYDKLRHLAEKKRDAGWSQPELYLLFLELFDRHQDDETGPFIDFITDILDSIWGGGIAKGHALYPTALTNKELDTYR